MTIALYLTSTVMALFVAVALFVYGLFVQAGLDASSLPAISLFGLAVVFFAVSTAYAMRLQDLIIIAAARSESKPR